MPLQRLTTRATPKATKAAARYTPAGGAERCGMCWHYAAPSSCARIEGPVSAAGWCQLYSQQVTWRPRAGQAAGSATAPSIDIAFLTPGSLDPSITFTRASTGTYFDVTGALQTAAINTPRWDYDPTTHVLRGMLSEEARTNSVLNSATLVTQNVTVTAVAWTLSFYGTGTVTKSGTASGALVGTGATTRVTQTFTPTAGTLTLTITGSVTNAQLEAGQTPTSYIPTTGASATRAAELAAMTPIPWFTAPASSLASEYMVPYPLLTNVQAFVSAELDDGTINNILALRNQMAAPGMYASVFIGNVAAGSVSAGAFSANTVMKHALALNNVALTGATAANAAAAVGFTSTGALPTLSRLLIGSGRSSPLNGWIRRVRYWPRVLSNAELQSVTT